MVKIGKIFNKKGKVPEDGSILSKGISSKFGRPSSPFKPSKAAASLVAAVTAAAAGNFPEVAVTDEKASTALKAPSGNSELAPTDEEREDVPVANDSVSDVASRDQGDDGSETADEQSYEGTMEEGSDTCDEAETYDEYTSRAGTADEEGTYDEDFTYDGTQQETATQATVTDVDSAKKYFHKDVVLNSLDDGANGLVIRAMYFIPKPKGEDHVVVKIEASTISARDCMRCKGHGVTKEMLPFVPGFEFVGTIQTLGDKSGKKGQFREGDRVAGVSSFGGGNSRFISIPADRLTKISNNVKSTHAVCLIHDYMAALRALRSAKSAGYPFTGMNMLITDGISPVGQAIINLASMEGANIYCCADESKHAYLASLGAKCFTNDPEVWLATAAGTFDVVIDNSCVDSYSSSWFALTKKGCLVCLAPVYNIGNDDLPQSACGLDITELQQRWSGLKAKYMMSQTSFLDTTTMYDMDTEQYKQDLRYLVFMLERDNIKPKVAERVSLDDVPDAQRLMQSGRANGTVVCVPWIEVSSCP